MLGTPDTPHNIIVYRGSWTGEEKSAHPGSYEVTVTLDEGALGWLIAKARRSHHLRTTAGSGAFVIRVHLPNGVSPPARKSRH